MTRRSFVNLLLQILLGIFVILGIHWCYAQTLPVSQAATSIATAANKNVIIMIGDGMGWQMTRAAAAAKTGRLYNSGKGTGLNMQRLAGYTLATTYSTTIGDVRDSFDTGFSALDYASPTTGASKVRPTFQFNPRLNPGKPVARPEATANVSCRDGAGTEGNGGNIVGYQPELGGPNPWTPLNPANPGRYNREYIKCSYPDSANTASALYTGVKSFSGALSVDIYEQPAETILQTASNLGKATGLVTSVPISHATPGAAMSSVNNRSKYDNDYPALDNILQMGLRSDLERPFLPTVLLGGGHPLDFENTTKASTVTPKGFRYLKASTYNELKTKPTNNRYGYQFIERDVAVTQTNDLDAITDGTTALLAMAQTIDPNQGDRLLGLYGTRGQNGNLPQRSASQDYSNTGLDAFSIFGGAGVSTTPRETPNNGTQIAKPDVDRPLAPGESVGSFIDKEVKANPTLADMSEAALTVLDKDSDGFWLMIEGGDIDWAAHDDNMDNLIGNVLAFDDAVGRVIDWIEANGGWERNSLIVTADHDHYLSLNPNFAQLLNQKGAKFLTEQANKPAEAGHFWGSEPQLKYGWGSHTNRMVPVYFQGDNLDLAQYEGQPVQFVDRPPNRPQTVYEIPGVPDAVDQTHIYLAMRNAL